MRMELKLLVVLNRRKGLYEASSADIFPESVNIVIIQYPDKEVRTGATNNGCLSCVFNRAHKCRLKGNPIHCTN